MGRIPGSGAVWLARRAGSAGDPSLRLKNGCAQDDTGNLLLPLAQNSEEFFAAHHVAVFKEVHHRLQGGARVRNRR